MKNTIFFFLLFIPFLPRFGAIDVIGAQWLYLSIVIVIFSLFFKFNFDLIKSKYIFHIYLFFISNCFFSFLYTNNLSITTMDFSRVFSIFLLILFLISNYTDFKFKKHHHYLLLFIFSFELLVSLLPLFFEFYGYFFDLTYSNLKPEDFTGFGANKNITAASIAIKLPYLFYLFHTRLFNFATVTSILIFLSFLDITFLSTRSVLLSSSISVFVLFLYDFSYFKRSFKTYIIPSLFIASFYANFLIIKFFDRSVSNSFSRLSSIAINKESSNGRFELWSNVIDYFLEHPFLGSGLGNWKIESLPYWNKLLSGYTVPYHAHNDFLELLTEIGLLGSLSYLFIFITLFYYIFRKFKSFTIIHICLLLSLFIYFTDAFFNFPLERTQMQIYFALLIFLIFRFDYEKDIA